MKPGSLSKGKTLLALFIVTACAVAFISWGRDQRFDQLQVKTDHSDTIPKKERKVRDLDEVINELDRIDVEIHLDKAMQEVNEALKQLNGEKMKLQIEKSLKDIELDKIKLEVDKAMKEVDFAKIEKELKESIAKIDFDKMQRELDEVRKIDLKELDEELAKARKELELAGPKLRKELDKAKVEIEKAKVEMKEYKSFVDGLDADGLINKKETYSIKHKDGKLLINDKEADSKTYNKYKSFLEKHKSFTIKKELDDFNIDVD